MSLFRFQTPFSRANSCPRLFALFVVSLQSQTLHGAGILQVDFRCPSEARFHSGERLLSFRFSLRPSQTLKLQGLQTPTKHVRLEPYKSDLTARCARVSGASCLPPLWRMSHRRMPCTPSFAALARARARVTTDGGVQKGTRCRFFPPEQRCVWGFSRVPPEEMAECSWFFLPEWHIPRSSVKEKVNCQTRDDYCSHHIVLYNQ